MNSVEGLSRNTTPQRFFVGEQVTRPSAGSFQRLWPVLEVSNGGNPEVVAEFVSRSDAETLARVLAARAA